MTLQPAWLLPFGGVQSGANGGGASQVTATAITKEIVEVTTSVAGGGMRLPAVQTGMDVFIINKSVNDIFVWPAVGESIYPSAVNASIVLKPNQRTRFVAASSGSWVLDRAYDIVNSPTISSFDSTVDWIAMYANSLNRDGKIKSTNLPIGISNLLDEAALDSTNDKLIFYDDSAGANRKTSLSNLVGLVPTPTLSGLLSMNVQTFTANGTYTPTTGMLFCIVELVGGGGGGAANVAGQSGASGAGGGYAKKLLTAADIGASKTVTIGPKGNKGVGAGGNGTAGGTTSLGALLSATGGAGGTGASSGLPGSGSGGNINVDGGNVESGFAAYSGVFNYGGDSFFGRGAAVYPGNGNNALGYGGGGGGGWYHPVAGTYNGGDGAAGFLMVTEFIGL